MFPEFLLNNSIMSQGLKQWAIQCYCTTWHHINYNFIIYF